MVLVEVGVPDGLVRAVREENVAFEAEGDVDAPARLVEAQQQPGPRLAGFGGVPRAVGRRPGQARRQALGDGRRDADGARAGRPPVVRDALFLRGPQAERLDPVRRLDDVEVLRAAPQLAHLPQVGGRVRVIVEQAARTGKQEEQDYRRLWTHGSQYLHIPLAPGKKKKPWSFNKASRDSLGFRSRRPSPRRPPSGLPSSRGSR